MKFSIIIPLYNKASYICCTVESVLAQSFADFEVIIVDDGSSDGGAELVASMTDSRLSMVRQANAGVSAARNRGIAMAKGEWVALLDADDWQHPDFLSCLILAQQTYPEADVVATDFVRVPDAEDSWPPKWPLLVDTPEVELITNLPARWKIGPTICSSAVAIRNLRLQQLQPCFAPGVSRGEDLDLWFRLAEQTPIALTHAPLVAYRVAVQDSLTTQHVVELTLPWYVGRMWERAHSGAMTEAQRKSTLWYVAQCELNMARNTIALGDRLQGVHWLIKARRAASGKRWWVTVFMACFFPKNLIKNWDHWRVSRKAIHIDTADAGR
ncbi:MAG: glycosyltransferase [Polaromonas sp.]